jgi:hypothetical protein
VHVVTGKDDTVLDEPKSFENGLQLNCISEPGFHATKKSSYLSLDEQAIHEDGIPFQLRAKVASKEDLAKLLKVVEESAKRQNSGLQRALDNWTDVVPSTPAFGSVMTQGTLAASIQSNTAVSTQEKPAPSVQDKSSQPRPAPSFGTNLSTMLNAASQHDTSNNHAQTGTTNPPNGPTALNPLMGDLRMQSSATASQSHPQLRDKPQLPDKPKPKPKKMGGRTMGGPTMGGPTMAMIARGRAAAGMTGGPPSVAVTIEHKSNTPNKCR